MFAEIITTNPADLLYANAPPTPHHVTVIVVPREPSHRHAYLYGFVHIWSAITGEWISLRLYHCYCGSRTTKRPPAEEYAPRANDHDCCIPCACDHVAYRIDTDCTLRSEAKTDDVPYTGALSGPTRKPGTPFPFGPHTRDKDAS